MGTDSSIYAQRNHKRYDLGRHQVWGEYDFVLDKDEVLYEALYKIFKTLVDGNIITTTCVRKRANYEDTKFFLTQVIRIIKENWEEFKEEHKYGLSPEAYLGDFEDALKFIEKFPNDSYSVLSEHDEEYDLGEEVNEL